MGPLGPLPVRPVSHSVPRPATGKGAVGLKFKALWKVQGGEEDYFYGEITAYNPSTKKHTLTYDDGTVVKDNLRRPSEPSTRLFFPFV